MTIYLELPDQELSDIKHFTNLENESEAVALAVHEFVRMSMRRERTTASVNAGFVTDWQNREELDLAECIFPH